ncbi:hypothetical protein CH35J_006617 [Colletotrichum higginsianum]|uniref:Uncharacterized protein n=1 Tax=Colletotrichum higginsianum TaxID=80884 RepID=A0A4T0VYN5_9PEZI|nr:hypothetical protein CH35J_006617 [Colletotrichum higginsianum]
MAEAATNEDSDSDMYSLGGIDEDEMNQLLATAAVAKAAQVPPSSVVHKMDQDSRSAESFDSQLQFSSPATSPGGTSKSEFSEPDLLDEDVDWNLVTACADEAAPSSRTKSLGEDSRPQTTSAPSDPAPFVRPSFPVKVRDRSVVVGLSSATMMRTCFRIGEMLNAFAKCAREKQDVVLELFARVNYSSRELSARVQHFQLRDLFTDRQPFLGGTLKG